MTVIENIEQFKKMLKPIMNELFEEWWSDKINTTKGLNSKDSAAYLQIAEGTFYNWVSDGKINAAYYTGSIPMYLISDLNALKQKPTLYNKV